MDLDEPEVLDGMRAWNEVQAEFAGALDPAQPVLQNLTCGWYDVSLDDNEGAFAIVKQGSVYEDLIGDVLRVRYRGKTAFVYCIGAARIPADISLFRSAFFQLGMLWTEEIRVAIRVVVPGAR